MSTTTLPSASTPPLSGLRRLAALTLLLARPSRQGRAAVVLPLAAFAVTTALLLTVVGGTLMFANDPRAQVEDLGGMYLYMSLVALLLLAVPTLSLGASAARLSARRRDDRLATLRLLGASSRDVSLITVFEATTIAVAGSLVGTMLYGLLLPLLGQLRFFDERIGAGAVWAGWTTVVGVLIAVALMATMSAVLGLRRVRLTPLGVRTRADAPRRPLRWALIGIGVILLGAAGISQLRLIGGAVGMAVMIVFVFVVFGFGLAMLNLIGPPIVAARGRAMARRAKSPSHLIAGKQLAEHSGPAWRRVSALAMIAFIAVVGGVGMSLASALSDGDDVDRAGQLIAADLTTGVLLTLAIAFVMLACSVGVTQAAAILDDAQLIVGLDRLGMPVTMLERSRRIAVMVPMRMAALGGAAAGAVLTLPLMGIAVFVAPMSILVVVSTFIVGFALVGLAFWATRPVVTAVRARPDRVG
ncbi:FtsX-like permease family protein [Aeromicrobium phragmitis]|uniref:FtsX-like permease family protein n=1 Tax=Aeromicrobium phragmitis TaxID=2478914 RepID=A0A3L8PIT4_9ACTN|nr:FtsX-like permease family protein [Aeromicrobium phragmitis]RLV55247.1 FtsX-like permease family protein [Aeromicrobium phragmitis]